MSTEETVSGDDSVVPSKVQAAAQAAVAGLKDNDVRYSLAQPETAAPGASEPAMTGFQGVQIPMSVFEAALAGLRDLDRDDAPAGDIGKDADAANLEATRQMALVELEDELDNTTDPDVRILLEEAKMRVAMARSPDSITAAVASARSTVAAASSMASGKDDAVQERISAMHQELYAHDAVYRHDVDQNTAQAHETLRKLDEGMKDANEWADAKGYKTTVDDKPKELREQIEAAEKDHNETRARDLQIQYMRVLQQQNEDRKRQAREAGDTEGLNRFEHADQTIGHGKEESTGQLNELYEKLNKATHRYMEANAHGVWTPAMEKEYQESVKMNETHKQEILNATPDVKKDKISTLKKQVESAVNFADRQQKPNQIFENSIAVASEDLKLAAVDVGDNSQISVQNTPTSGRTVKEEKTQSSSPF